MYYIHHSLENNDIIQGDLFLLIGSQLKIATVKVTSGPGRLLTYIPPEPHQLLVPEAWCCLPVALTLSRPHSQNLKDILSSLLSLSSTISQTISKSCWLNLQYVPNPTISHDSRPPLSHHHLSLSWLHCPPNWGPHSHWIEKKKATSSQLLCNGCK